MIRPIFGLLMVVLVAVLGDGLLSRFPFAGSGLVWFIATAIVFALGTRTAFATSKLPFGQAFLMVALAAAVYGAGGHVLRTTGDEAILISVESAAIALLSGTTGLTLRAQTP